MKKIFNWILTKSTAWTSYSSAITLSAAVSAAIAIVFALYYVNAIKFPLNYEMKITLIISIIIGYTMHGLQFGAFSRLKFSGFTSTIRIINRSITSDSEVIIKELEDKEYINLLNSLKFLPPLNSTISVLWVVIIGIALFTTGFLTSALTTKNIPTTLILFIILSIIHGGFSLIIGEIMNGEMIAKCKKIMYDKNIPFEDKNVTSLSFKLFFAMILFIITIFVSNTLTFYSKGNFSEIIVFPIIAVLVFILMFFLLFKIIFNSLQDIGIAIDDLKTGGTGLIFTRSVDKEIISIASGVLSAAETISDYRQNLEQKVEERTNELIKTLDRVENLKNQQDGDYYLTSLLTKPLLVNVADDEDVKIDFFVKQKKTFQFRKWNNELGGDLCAAYNVTLDEKKYTAFLNADAMGKSMQGAGGSLVLGSVYQAIINRTLFDPNTKDIYPEIWLESSFWELQKVFESFEETMLISFMMGLVDNSNGFMYYINAEHPWPVLYRDNVTKFLSKRLSFRKLGTRINDRPLIIQTFQMEKDDVIIAGSDGRDDIIIKEDDNTLMNDDETLFLNFVEKGDGILDNIVESITNKAELTDDLSLLRIKYIADSNKNDSSGEVSLLLKESRNMIRNGSTGEAINNLKKYIDLNPENRSLFKTLGSAFFTEKRYSEAIPYLLEYIKDNPRDANVIMVLSECYKKIKDYESALKYSKRLCLREPLSEKNLLTYISLLEKNKNYDDAIKLADSFLNFDEENNAIKKKKADLESKIS